VKILLEYLLIENIQKSKRISEKTNWDLLVQSLSGLLYLHETKKIIHRDIKEIIYYWKARGI
jgi:serine/threonine protein kinase